MPEQDRCEHCQTQLQIICLKFRFGSVAMVWACPNCAEASVSDVAQSSGASPRGRRWGLHFLSKTHADVMLPAALHLAERAPCSLRPSPLALTNRLSSLKVI